MRFSLDGLYMSQFNFQFSYIRLIYRFVLHPLLSNANTSVAKRHTTMPKYPPIAIRSSWFSFSKCKLFNYLYKDISCLQINCLLISKWWNFCLYIFKNYFMCVQCIFKLCIFRLNYLLAKIPLLELKELKNSYKKQSCENVKNGQ